MMAASYQSLALAALLSPLALSPPPRTPTPPRPRAPVPPYLAELSIDQAAEADAVDLTKKWIQQVVIRLGLCPYASKPFVADKIRYVVSDADDDASLINDFFDEAALLLDCDEEDMATTFLVAPNYEEGIEAFYWL